MPLEWYGDKVEAEVDRKLVMGLDRLGLYGVTRTKQRITEEGRIETGRMRADITHEIDPRKFRVRWGGSVHYLIYQELGTLSKDGSQRIKPMFALRGSLADVKREFNRLFRL